MLIYVCARKKVDEEENKRASAEKNGAGCGETTKNKKNTKKKEGDLTELNRGGGEFCGRLLGRCLSYCSKTEHWTGSSGGCARRGLSGQAYGSGGQAKFRFFIRAENCWAREVGWGGEGRRGQTIKRKDSGV